MKSALGAPARGSAFYPRPIEVKKIYRVLNSNTGVYLSAPRRVGKTSILKYLEDNPEEGYYFIYSITESVFTINDFFKVLCESILESKAVSLLTKISQGFSEFFNTWIGRVRSIRGIELEKQKDTNFEELFLELLGKIQNEAGKVIIMIDEFPQTIHNIEREQGRDTAIHFIQLNREIRHKKVSEEKVLFIYTGSISLFPMVEKMVSLTAVNDLRPIVVEPWNKEDSLDMLQKLSKNDNIEVADGVFEYMLDTIKWYIPFHMQLIYHEMVNIYDQKEKILDKHDVDIAIEKTVEAKNKAQFDPYFTRLEGLLNKQEFLFSIDILKHTAKYGKVDESIVYDFSKKYKIEEYNSIIEMLCVDGYLNKENKTYTYTSPILQLWCTKHICNGPNK